MRNNLLPLPLIIAIVFSTLTCLGKSRAITVFTLSEYPLTEIRSNIIDEIVINSKGINGFFIKYPDLKKYETELNELYLNRQNKAIWFNDGKLVELSYLLYSKINSLREDGLEIQIENQELLSGIFNENSILKTNLSQAETDIMISAMYLFYFKNMFQGKDPELVKSFGWLLPGKDICYQDVLDSLLEDPELFKAEENSHIKQYYKLKDALKKYREIQERGDWLPIKIEAAVERYKPLDSSATISQIRHRLFVMGDLKEDSKSNLYDDELMAAILNFKKRFGFKSNYYILPEHIAKMNISVEEYIRKICINMERCRWVDPQLTNAPEYLLINIPAYKLYYKKDGETRLESKVIVGQNMMETVIFSNEMSSIVFSPYWYVPQSIIDNELKYAIEQDSCYLYNRNMEWNAGKVRQLPGPKNALGLVKFVFPNSKSIYLHDTPSKVLFDMEYRAFSHGCINMEKAKDLALLLLKEDDEWSEEKIHEAMKGKEESVCVLKNKIPVHMVYFTAFVDDNDNINFYEDVYERDSQLTKLMLSN